MSHRIYFLIFTHTKYFNGSLCSESNEENKNTEVYQTSHYRPSLYIHSYVAVLLSRGPIYRFLSLNLTSLSMGVDFYSTLGGPLIEAPMSNAEGFPLPTGGGVWGRGSAPFPENFSIADLHSVWCFRV